MRLYSVSDDYIMHNGKKVIRKDSIIVIYLSLLPKKVTMPSAYWLIY